MAVSTAMPRPNRRAAGLRGLAVLVALFAAAPGQAQQIAHHSKRYAHVRLTHSFAMVVPVAKSPRLLPPKPHPLPTAAALYQRSLHADDLFSYRGRQVTTYWRTGHTVAVLVAHRAPSQRRIDYLAPDAQRGRSLVTDEHQEWQFDPRSSRLLHRLRAANADAVEDAAQSYDLLRTNYILQVLPQTKTVADRKAYLVTMTRRTNHALARKLWIDASTGLVLKRENYREDGKLVLTVAYTDLSFRAPLPRSLFDLAPLAHRAGVHLVEEKAAEEKSLPLNAVRGQWGGTVIVPPSLAGYRLVSAGLSSDGAKPMLHLRYSDGLNLVSLFELPRTQTKKPTRVPASMRPVQIGRSAGHVSHRASLTAFNWDKGGLNLTLMGEIAEPALQALAVAAEQARP
jgi:outer membrane lipoprotein-sorting protein